MMKAQEPFSTTEVATLTGVSYRCLDYWTNTGLIEPSVASATGSGSARRFSQADLDKVVAIKTLLDLGVSLQFIRSQGNDPYRAVDVLRERLAPLAVAS